MPPAITVEAIRIPDKIGTGVHRNGGGPDKWLRPLSKANVLIGPNNSGKSRLLRGLFSGLGPDFTFAPSLPLLRELRKAAQEFPRALRARIEGDGPAEHAKRIEDLIEVRIGVSGWCSHLESGQPVPRMWDGLMEVHHEMHSITSRFNHIRPANEALAKAMNHFYDLMNPFPAQFPQKTEFAKVYVPSLRGLRQLTGGPDHYQEITANEYKLSLGKQKSQDSKLLWTSEVVTGQGLYSELKRRLLGSLVERQWVREYEQYLARIFFRGEAVALIPRLEGPLHIKIGTETERPIHDLGDGLQQLIILTYPFMLNRDKHVLLFVEEPELYLHPGFQRALIDAWLDYQGSLQVFVATHSSEFLDITLDRNQISVFRCRKELPNGEGAEKDAKIVVTSVSDDGLHVLRELGIRNSSVMLSNCTIWVEGITDRMYLRRWLVLYQAYLEKKKEPRVRAALLEDVHYSFVEYSGNNITHWSFLEDDRTATPINEKRLCGELLLVMDLDDERNEAKKERRKKLLTVLGADRFHVLPVKEIENLLTPEVIEVVVRDREGDGVVVKPFGQADYAKTGLGKFIEDTILDGKGKRVWTSGTSETVSRKSEFAQVAIEAMTDWDALSSDAKALTTKVYSFIQSHNPY